MEFYSMEFYFHHWAKSVFTLGLAGRVYLLVSLSSHWAAIANLITAKWILGLVHRCFA